MQYIFRLIHAPLSKCVQLNSRVNCGSA